MNLSGIPPRFMLAPLRPRITCVGARLEDPDAPRLLCVGARWGDPDDDGMVICFHGTKAEKATPFFHDLNLKKLRRLNEIRPDRYDGPAAELGRRKMPDHLNSMNYRNCPNTTRCRLKHQSRSETMLRLWPLFGTTFCAPPLLQGGEQGG